MQIHVPQSVKAPVAKGQKLGEIVFTLNEFELAKTDVLAETAVEATKVPKTFHFFWDHSKK